MPKWGCRATTADGRETLRLRVPADSLEHAQAETYAEAKRRGLTIRSPLCVRASDLPASIVETLETVGE